MHGTTKLQITRKHMSQLMRLWYYESYLVANPKDRFSCDEASNRKSSHNEQNISLGSVNNCHEKTSNEATASQLD